MPITVAQDLRTKFGPPRDQGARPTCLAFAVSDCHAGLRDGWIPLSCECAFYHAQRRAGRPPSEGAILKPMLDALREDGQPVEDDWPYLNVTHVDPGAWAPPGGVMQVYHRAGEPLGSGYEELVALLDGGIPAVVIMSLSDSFYAPDDRGVVVAPPDERPDPKRRHAVVAVGHGAVDGEKAVLIRNSWGAAWGLKGHAWLPHAYFAPRLLRISVLKEEVNVLTNRTAA